MKRVFSAAAGGAVAFTLMACYGAAPYPMEMTAPTGDCDGTTEDIDGDGWCAGDCDETNPAIFPGGEDAPGDGIDGDCDGKDGPEGAAVTMAE